MSKILYCYKCTKLQNSGPNSQIEIIECGILKFIEFDNEEFDNVTLWW